MHALFFLLKLVHDSIVLLLLLIVVSLNVSHLLPDGAHLLDVRGKLHLLVLYLLFNQVHKRRQFLQRLALCVVKLLFKLGHALDLLIDFRIAHDALLFFKVSHEFIYVLRA